MMELKIVKSEPIDHMIINKYRNKADGELWYEVIGLEDQIKAAIEILLKASPSLRVAEVNSREKTVINGDDVVDLITDIKYVIASKFFKDLSKEPKAYYIGINPPTQDPIPGYRGFNIKKEDDE